MFIERITILLQDFDLAHHAGVQNFGKHNMVCKYIKSKKSSSDFLKWLAVFETQCDGNNLEKVDL